MYQTGTITKLFFHFHKVCPLLMFAVEKFGLQQRIDGFLKKLNVFQIIHLKCISFYFFLLCFWNCFLTIWVSTSFLLSSFWSQRTSLWLIPCSFFCGQLLPHLIYFLPLLFPVFLLFWSQPSHICHFSCLWPTITIPTCSLLKICSSQFSCFSCALSPQHLCCSSPQHFSWGTWKTAEIRWHLPLRNCPASWLLGFVKRNYTSLLVLPVLEPRCVSNIYQGIICGRCGAEMKLSIKVFTDLTSWYSLLKFKP